MKKKKSLLFKKVILSGKNSLLEPASYLIMKYIRTEKTTAIFASIQLFIETQQWSKLIYEIKLLEISHVTSEDNKMP